MAMTIASLDLLANMLILRSRSWRAAGMLLPTMVDVHWPSIHQVGLEPLVPVQHISGGCIINQIHNAAHTTQCKRRRPQRSYGFCQQDSCTWWTMPSADPCTDSCLPSTRRPSPPHQVIPVRPQQHVLDLMRCHRHQSIPAMVIGGLQQWQAFTVRDSRHSSRSSNNHNYSSSSSKDTTPRPAEPTSTSTEDGGAGDDSRRRRRGTTESRTAALRRTTESRAAIEDVAVMTKSQLTRRNKAWLVEQCWERKLPYDGLKDDLVHLLLDWQQTDAGRAAAAEAAAAAAEAAALPHAPAQLSTCPSNSSSINGDGQGQSCAARLVAAAAAERAAQQGVNLDVGDLELQHQYVSSRRKRRQSTSSSSGSNNASMSLSQSQPRAAAQDFSSGSTPGPEADSTAAPAGLQVQQPPRNAAEASLDTLRTVMQQLRQQTDNPAVIAVARNALEAHVQRSFGCSNSNSLISNSSSSPALARQDGAAAALCQLVLESSSPKSLAVLAKACFSREQQQPVLAAAMAAAVAAVAKKLGPQEVYGVLRLLAEHLKADSWESEEGDELATAMREGFQVLAEGMITFSEALSPVQLAEAVQLLQHHRYSDPYGLWMLAKQAARRLQDFRPSEVTAVLDAVAEMCVADESLCEDVAVVVLGNKGAFSGQQLQQVQAALQRMGYACSSFL